MPKKQPTEHTYMGTGVESDLEPCPDCESGFAEADGSRCRDCEEAAIEWYTVRIRG